MKKQLIFSFISLIMLIGLSSFEEVKKDFSHEDSISLVANENSDYAVNALKNYPTPYAVSFSTERLKDAYAMSGTVTLRTSGAASYCFVECFKNGACWDCFDHDCKKTRICGATIM